MRHGFCDMSKGFLLGVFLCSAVLAGPTMPVGFAVATASEENTTWRQSGELAMSYEMAVAAVKATLTCQGYAERHDIVPDEATKQRIMLWEKDDEKIIVMMWQKEIAKTGCAWGVSQDE